MIKIITYLPGISPAPVRNEQESRRSLIRFVLFLLLFWRWFKNEGGGRGAPGRIRGPAGVWAGCGGSSPRAGGFGLPGPSQPLPRLPRRQPRRGGGRTGTAQGGWGRSSSPRRRLFPVPITPAKTFTRDNCLPGVCGGKARVPGWGSEREGDGTYGAAGFGGGAGKGGTGRAPAELPTHPGPARSSRAEIWFVEEKNIPPKEPPKAAGEPGGRGGILAPSEGRSPGWAPGLEATRGEGWTRPRRFAGPGSKTSTIPTLAFLFSRPTPPPTPPRIPSAFLPFSQTAETRKKRGRRRRNAGSPHSPKPAGPGLRGPGVGGGRHPRRARLLSCPPPSPGQPRPR